MGAERDRPSASAIRDTERPGEHTAAGTLPPCLQLHGARVHNALRNAAGAVAIVTLHARTLLGAGSLIVTLIAFVFVAAAFTFHDLADQVERETIDRDLVRFGAIWNDFNASLEDTTRDWATWDDAYEFVSDRNAAFVQSNLVDQTFRNLHINVILFVDAQGQPVFAKAFDVARNQSMTVPPELIALFGPGSPLLTASGVISGPVLTDGLPLMIAAAPIVNSTGSTPSRGTLVMGRQLDDAQIAELARATQLDIAIFRADDGTAPADAVAARRALSPANRTYVAQIDDATEAGYVLIDDVHGVPALVARARAPRTMRALSDQALRYFLVVLSLFGAAALVVLFWQLERQVLQPLAHISAAVQYVGRAGDSSLRIPLLGARQDEIARLAATVNHTLDALERSHQKLAESEARYRQLNETVPDVVYTLALSDRGELVIETLNPAFERTSGFKREEWLGRSIAELVHPDDLPRALSLFGTTDNSTYYLRIRNSAGAYRTVALSSATRIVDGVPVGSMGIGRDVTDRLRLEAQFQAVAFASEQFLRAADWRQEIDAVLARLGTASAVSRVYLFQNTPGSDGDVLTSQQYEWCAPGIAPQIDNPRLRRFALRASGFERWMQVLSRAETLTGRIDDFPAGEQAILREQAIASLLVIPIFAVGKWWGFIGFDDCTAGREFPAVEQEALRTAAGAIGAAIHRSAIEEERARDRHLLALINEVTRAALMQPDTRGVSKLLADKLDEFIEADGCYVTLWDENAQRAIPFAASAAGVNRFEQIEAAPGEMTLTESVLRERRVLAVTDAAHSPYISARLMSAFPAQSLLGLPLMAGERKLGAAIISFNHQHEFSADEIALGERLADQFSLVLARARLLDESNARAAQLAALHETALDVSASRDAVGLLDKIVARATDLLNSESGSLYLCDPDARTVRCVVSHQTEDYRGVVLQYGEGAAGAVAASGQPLIIDDYAAWSGRARAFQNARPVGAVMSVPLAWRGQVTGVIHVFDRKRRYRQSDVELLSLFAEQASIAVENARLFGEVERLALTDDLTGVFNRRHLMTILGQEVQRARRLSRPLALLIVDLDFFKQINDSYGHVAGDLTLRALADRLRTRIRDIDTLARYGGEEFVIALPEADSHGAALAAERLRQNIADEPFQIGSLEIALSVSIGVAVLTDSDSGADSVLERADSALYKAKGLGRNRVIFAV